MNKNLQDLLVVQDRDMKLQKLEAEMRRVPKDVAAESERLNSDKAAVEEAKQNLQKVEVEAGKLKLDRRTRQDTIEKLKVQMFETKKNEEYAALGSDVKRYEAQVSDIETEELELMEKCDELKEVLEQAKAALAERENMVKANVEELKDKARVLVDRFKEAKKDRAVSTEGVDADALALYERIYKSKGDAAIAELRGDICGGCNMKIVPSTLSRLRAGDELTQCENCSRILYEA